MRRRPPPSHRRSSTPHHPRGGEKQQRPQNAARLGNGYYLYGTHAVEAALRNTARRVHDLFATAAALDSLKQRGIPFPPALKVVPVDRHDLSAKFGADSVHQGIALRCEPLDTPSLDAFLHHLDGEDAAARQTLVMLDQVTDPHNVGAILRSCAALGARAVIVQDRHSPEESATLAKSACGAMEHVPMLAVVNLSRALDDLKDAGYTCIGLDERGTVTLPAYEFPAKTVIVMGAEGQGLRRLVAEHCDALMTIPTYDIMKSLNVSNAMAVTLYEIHRRLCE